jgi:hypothetical protein
MTDPKRYPRIIPVPDSCPRRMVFCTTQCPDFEETVRNYYCHSLARKEEAPAYNPGKKGGKNYDRREAPSTRRWRQSRERYGPRR